MSWGYPFLHVCGFCSVLHSVLYSVLHSVLYSVLHSVLYQGPFNVALHIQLRNSVMKQRTKGFVAREERHVTYVTRDTATEA